MSDDTIARDLAGVQAIAEGRIPWDLSEDINSAIEHGLAYDADPTYWAQDINARRKIALTDDGLIIAAIRGWLVACSCGPSCRFPAKPTSDRGQAQARRNPRYADMCSGCYATGAQYGFFGDQCSRHFKESKQAKEVPA